MTARDALSGAVRTLEAHGIPTPHADGEWLLAHVLGVTRAELALTLDSELTPGEARHVEQLVERRRAREPLAYVLGDWGFRRLSLRTDARALVPRPETEVVVERCLALLRGRDAPRVLDVGTGSGAIALAVADEHPGARVTGVDADAAALALARENARRLGLQLELRLGSAEVAVEGWDLVVSNPPYVRADEVAGLEPEVRDWEPRAALVGADLYEPLAETAQTDWLVLEVAAGRAAHVARALERLRYADVAITRDLSGVERVVEGRRP